MTRILAFCLIGIICLLPFADIMESRMQADNGSSDMENVIDGRFINVAQGNGDVGGTMTYRFAWVSERALYLSKRPLSENIFGLGTMRDGDPQVRRYYHFSLGLFNKKTLSIHQMGTPDIAYGNLLIWYGYVGMALFISIWIRIGFRLYRNRDKDDLFTFGAIYVLFLLLESFAGMALSQQYTLVLPFLLLTNLNNYDSRRLRLEKMKQIEGTYK